MAMLNIRTLYFIIPFWFVSLFGNSYEYEIAATAIFQNEAPYLAEWIQYHRLIGVEHFYLYNNRSTDEFYEVLAPFVIAGWVELIDWPYTYEKPGEWNLIQCKAYEDAVQLSKKKAKWLAILDIDEYIVPVQHDNLKKALKEFGKCGAVCPNWQMYGTSSVDKIPADRLMIETLVRKAPSQYGENAHVKSIVRPKAVRKVSNPHVVSLKKGYHQFNTNHEQTAGPISPTILTDKIRINHYWTKDEEFFFNRKVGRRAKWSEGYNGMIERKNNLDQEEDLIMMRFVKKLRKRMGM